MPYSSWWEQDPEIRNQLAAALDREREVQNLLSAYQPTHTPGYNRLASTAGVGVDWLARQLFDKEGAIAKAGRNLMDPEGTVAYWNRLLEANMPPSLKETMAGQEWENDPLENPFLNALAPENIGIVGMFAGPKAQGWKNALKKVGNGADEVPEGAFSSLYDKKPRFEIDDSVAKVLLPGDTNLMLESAKREGLINQSDIEHFMLNINRSYSKKTKRYSDIIKRIQRANKLKLPDVLDHQVLFNEYPELKNIELDYPGAGMSAYNDTIGIPRASDYPELYDSEKYKNNLLHEIQHLIQEREDFATGTKVSDRNYRVNAGEIEARDTSSRSSLNMLERAKIPPYSSENIPVENALVRFGGGEAQMAKNKLGRNMATTELRGVGGGRKNTEEIASLSEPLYQKELNSVKDWSNEELDSALKKAYKTGSDGNRDEDIEYVKDYLNYLRAMRGMKIQPQKADIKRDFPLRTSGSQTIPVTPMGYVANDLGEPLIVHHATNETFSKFKDTNKHPGVAGMFKEMVDYQYGPIDVPAKLKAKKILDLTDVQASQPLEDWIAVLRSKGVDFTGAEKEIEDRFKEEGVEYFTGLFQREHPRGDLKSKKSKAIKAIKEAGYDGVKWFDTFPDEKMGNPSYLVFSPSQIEMDASLSSKGSKNALRGAKSLANPMNMLGRGEAQMAGKGKIANIKPDDTKWVDEIVYLHEVRDSSKKGEITKAMQESGWQGPPILAVDTGNGVFAITGSHRWAAAKDADIQVPVKLIDYGKVERWAAKNDMTIDDLLSGDDDSRLEMLKKIGDKDAVALMRHEINKDY